MSLGTTVSPSGETGMVEAVRPMPDQIPDNPATIAASTSIENIESVMYRDWVWRNTFYIDTTMQPGTIFGFIKIHPKNCNDYITHIAAMFKTWVGSMKIRARFMATFQFGGSFRMGWLPPIFTESELTQLPIQTLTAYPNIDLDPKNTQWNQFQAAEERNILFHWMEDVETVNPAAFGGWYVFYVAAPLVVSGGTNSQISLLIESTGSFNFAQLAPISAIAPSTNAWIDQDNLGTQAGREDSHVITHMQILPSTIKNIPTGYLSMLGLSGITVDNNPAVTLSNRMKAMMNLYPKGKGSTCVFRGLYKDTSLSPEFDMNSIEWNQSETLPHTAYENLTLLAASGKPNITLISKVFYNDVYIYHGDAIAGSSTATTMICSLGTATAVETPIDTTKMPIALLPGTGSDESALTNPLDESIILFVNTNTRTYNTQTFSQASSLTQAAGSFDKNISQLYQVVNRDTGVVLLNVRLTPYGYFTTNPLDAVALLPGQDLYFRYLQSLPMSSPLPPLASTMRSNLRKAIRYTEKGKASELMRAL